MKRAIPVIVVGCLGVAAGFWLRGQEHVAPTSEQAKARAIQSAMTPRPGEKIAHTFTDETQVRQFANLWQQRSGMLMRIAMLESYANNEQATLTRIDTQFQSQYSVDPSKNYSLNTAQRTIVERQAPSAPAQEAPAQPAAAPAAKSAKVEQPAPATAPAAQQPQENVVHTFADEAAMQEFAKLWQQRQSVIVRMAVLKNYRDVEKNNLVQIEKKLAGDYSMDMAKQYTLDEKRRVLIERQVPPAPQVAPARPAAAAGQPGAGASAPQPADAAAAHPSPTPATPSQASNTPPTAQPQGQ